MTLVGFVPALRPWSPGAPRNSAALCRRPHCGTRQVRTAMPIRAQSFPPEDANDEAAEIMARLGPDKTALAAMAAPTSEQVESSRVQEPSPSISSPQAGDMTWLESVLSTMADEGSVAPALRESRRQAIEQTNVAELPTRRMEPWRFTDLRKLFALRFSADREIDSRIDAREFMPQEVGTILVCVDGVYVPELSILDDDVAAMQEKGGYLGSIRHYNGDVARALTILNSGELNMIENGIFLVLNTALARDSCVIDISANVSVEKPIGILHVSSGGSESSSATISCPKLVMLAGEASKATVLEYHIAANKQERPWFCSLASTGVSVSPNSNIEHYVVCDCPGNSHFISHVNSEISSDATYNLFPIGFGGQVCRFNARLNLNSPGGYGGIQGVLIADEYRIADLHSSINHLGEACTSNQYQKNLASDHARAIFNGRIIVAKGASKTESEQLCRSMLLSDKAQIDAMPVLEISTSDVKCSHGATISDVNEDELFYCQSRGLSRKDAQQLLIMSFAVDILQNCPFKLLHDRIAECSKNLVLTASNDGSENGPSMSM